MRGIELLLEIYTKWNGYILSDTARNNSTVKQGNATWTEHTVGGDGRDAAGSETCSCTRELRKPEGGGTSWRKDLDKGREKVEKSASEEQTERKIKRKGLWKPGIGS